MLADTGLLTDTGRVLADTGLLPAAPEGLAVVDKPAGCTSHDVVARVRRLAGTRRVGHAGTLDPMATGVLVLGLGRATRLLGHLALTDKDYLASLLLGAATSTDDAEGEVISRADPSGVSDHDLAAAVRALTGTLSQVPPGISAIKVAGRRAYARTRAGEQLTLAPRTVTVSEFTVTARSGALVQVRIRCSTGTYVRALARDLGAALGVGAHLTALRRTRVGPFTDPAPLDGPLSVVPLPDAVRACFAVRTLTEAQAADVRHGRRVTPSGRPGPVGAFGPDGTLLALLTDTGTAAQPTVVLHPATKPGDR